MKAKLQPNRAICRGDRGNTTGGRSHPESREAIVYRMSGWDTAFLHNFVKISRSKRWKRVALGLIAQRADTLSAKTPSPTVTDAHASSCSGVTVDDSQPRLGS